MMKEQTLINGLIENDVRAFKEFVDVYSIDILKTISYVLKESQDKDYIEECFDDVVMQVLKKSETFKFECPFRNWVMCIAKNKALDYKRKIKKYYNEVELHEDISENKSAEDEYLKEEISKRFSDIVNKLGEKEKTLFVKKYILDISTKELCIYYVISENVLYKRLSRLREKIKKLWENSERIKEDIYE